MQATEYYEKLITEGIRHLPPEALAEISDFVYFIRLKVARPEHFSHDRETELLAAELKILNETETRHLEDEFRHYARDYPRE